METGHRNSGFSHEKWWIFPWQNVSSPEGNLMFIVGNPNLPFGDGLYRPFMVILGIVEYWVYHINRDDI